MFFTKELLFLLCVLWLNRACLLRGAMNLCACVCRSAAVVQKRLYYSTFQFFAAVKLGHIPVSLSISKYTACKREPLCTFSSSGPIRESLCCCCTVSTLFTWNVCSQTRASVKGRTCSSIENMQRAWMAGLQCSFVLLPHWSPVEFRLSSAPSIPSIPSSFMLSDVSRVPLIKFCCPAITWSHRCHIVS